MDSQAREGQEGCETWLTEEEGMERWRDYRWCREGDEMSRRWDGGEEEESE